MGTDELELVDMLLDDDELVVGVVEDVVLVVVFDFRENATAAPAAMIMITIIIPTVTALLIADLLTDINCLPTGIIY